MIFLIDLQICDAEVVKLLSLIFENCVQYRIFPNLWKKSNIVSIHKEGDKQCMVNYHPVLFLPICGKTFEQLIFNPVFEFLEENRGKQKTETVGISGDLHKFSQSFLSDRLLTVVLNGQSSNWSPILTGVPQGSIFGPLLFLVYISNIPDKFRIVSKIVCR